MVFFRSRSYPVPHRGERVKQRTVHPQNFAFFTLKDGFMLFIIPGYYNSFTLPSELTYSDIQGVSGGTVNILGCGSMDYSK